MDNNHASEKVLESVEKSLQRYPFSYQGARIITGQEEGAFGWITVNYLSNNFRKVEHTLQSFRMFISKAYHLKRHCIINVLLSCELHDMTVLWLITDGVNTEKLSTQLPTHLCTNKVYYYLLSVSHIRFSTLWGMTPNSGNLFLTLSMTALLSLLYFYW